MTVYDYANNAVDVELPDKPIASIFVHVQSGDETGIVTFKDGTAIPFDASYSRFLNFDDGAYCVQGEENISAWLNFEPSGAVWAYGSMRCFLEMLKDA